MNNGECVVEQTLIRVMPERPAVLSCVCVRVVPQYVYCVRAVEPAKAFASIRVTELGIVREVSDDAPEKALSPIPVTESGIDKFVSEVKPEKA